MTVGPSDIQTGPDPFEGEDHHGAQEIQNPSTKNTKTKRKRSRSTDPKISESKKAKKETTKKKCEDATLPSGASTPTDDAAGTIPVSTCPLKGKTLERVWQDYHSLCHRYEMLRDRYVMLRQRRSNLEPRAKKARREEEEEEEEEEEWFFIVARL